MENERKLLVRLGIIDKETNYKEMVLDLFTKNIAGLYVAEEDTMYILEESTSLISPALPNEVVVHEVVHALQDQYVSLDKLEEDLKKVSDDKRMAMQAIIEGEATFVSYSISADFVEKMVRNMSAEINLESLDLERWAFEYGLAVTKSFSQDFKNKTFIQYLLFPYLRGGMFIKYAFDNGGWDKVDAIYKNFPLSTEQILHPEKYFLVKDEPLALKEKNLDFLLTEGFKEISRGNLGEITLYTVAELFLDDLHATMLSGGWGNDYYYLYEKGTLGILVIDSIWDSVLEAEEFNG